ncbi:kelch-like protein 32 [Lates japonicus]|uniref:Kelch-like protein 32 n=1 Tax=Lates japonicus TaxID=270547 RepID=A0AAD3M7B0_LATJO|nr:kelch-like protein 32 [Lates japonicus]
MSRGGSNWSELAPAYRRSHHCVAVMGTSCLLWVVRWSTPPGGDVLPSKDCLWSMTPGATRWTEIAPMKACRGTLCLGALGQYLYAVGAGAS